MRPYARYPTGFPVGFFFAFYFFWVGGPVGHKHIQPTRESRAVVGGGWARRAQAQNPFRT